jgi:hypothetical protein
LQVKQTNNNNENVKNEQKGNYETQESIPPAGPSNRVVVPASQAGNRFLGSLKGLQILAQGGDVHYCAVLYSVHLTYFN